MTSDRTVLAKLAELVFTVGVGAVVVYALLTIAAELKTYAAQW